MQAIPTQRHLFDIPDDVAYFNSAYNSPLLNESINRLLVGVQTKKHPWDRTAESFFDDAETIRYLASECFGGDADGYAVIPAASYGISTAARAIEPHLEKGDRILLLSEEFPSNVLPWKRVAQEKGALIETILAPQDGDWTQAILVRIEPGVKVVAVSTCHWTNGAYIDLISIGKACRDVGSVLTVDATQTLGAMAIPMAEVKPDFLVAAGYKWLLSPYGFGLLYVSKQWRNSRPLEEVWLARENAEDFTGLVKYSDIYKPGSRRFDMGEKCIPTILPGVIAALEQIKAWGVESIASTLSSINDEIAAHLEGLGCILSPRELRCPHMFGAQLPGTNTNSIVTELKGRKIFVSQRGSALRIAPHLFVNEQDISRLKNAVSEFLGEDHAKRQRD